MKIKILIILFVVLSLQNNLSANVLYNISIAKENVIKHYKGMTLKEKVSGKSLNKVSKYEKNMKYTALNIFYTSYLRNIWWDSVSGKTSSTCKLNLKNENFPITLAEVEELKNLILKDGYKVELIYSKDNLVYYLIEW